MKKATRYTLPYRRKREGKTNYKKRLSLLLSEKPRLVVRKSNKHTVIQLITYQPKGDVVELTYHTSALKKLGWKYATSNLPASYLAGFAFGKQALAKKIKNAIVDFGFQPSIPASRLYAVLKGIVDAGVSIPVDEAMFPKEDRLMGKHIASYHDQKKNISADVAALKATLEKQA